MRVEPGSERYTEALTELFKDVVGKPVDPEDLGKRVTGYYGKGNLEALDYALVKDDDGSLRPRAHRAPQFLGPELRALRPEPAGRLRGQFHSTTRPRVSC